MAPFNSCFQNQLLRMKLSNISRNCFNSVLIERYRQRKQLILSRDIRQPSLRCDKHLFGKNKTSKFTSEISPATLTQKVLELKEEIASALNVYCLMFHDIYDMYVLLVKQGEETQASRSELVHYMQTLQWISD